MDLRRLKTVFIIVLAFLNIMFCVILNSAQNYEKEEQRIMTESLSQLLAKDMIYLPGKMEIPRSPDIYGFYLEKMFGENDDLVKRFLGENWSEVEKGVYESENGRLRLEGNEFKFFNTGKVEEVTDFSEESMEKLCRQEMKRLGILSDLYVFSGINFVDNGIKAIFTAKHQDAVFFDAYISFDVTATGISLVSGKNMVSSLDVNHTQERFFNATSILPDLAQNTNLKKGTAHTIVSIIPGYYIGKTVENYRNILAIPVWQIATDSGIILYYDARNGQPILE